MILNEIAKRTGKFATDNSPALLTGVGVAGVATTAFLSGMAGYRAANIIRDAQSVKTSEMIGDSPGSYVIDDALTPKEKVRLVWPEFVPPIIAGVSTVTAIVLATKIGMRRTAAMAAAFQISERAYGEYRAKAEEVFGKNKEQNLRDQIAQDRVTTTPNREILIFNDGEQLCFDKPTNRYFKSSMQEIVKAANDLNYELLRNGSASQSDFFIRLGLPTSPMTDRIGWFSDHMLEVEYSSAIAEDDRPCLVIDYHMVPIQDPDAESWRD